MWEKLINWSHSEFSELPWRKKRTLYTTLVSEIMLQQTTVATVLNHFDRFIQQFPNLEKLAKSSDEEMLIAWKGLGYYRRAKNLRSAALEIKERFNGKFPIEREKLLEIKGIGPYTASALISIGRDQRALAIDANLERVLARFYGLKTPKGPKLQKEIQTLFETQKILHDLPNEVSFRDLNEALMDLGRTYCQSRKATCELCKLQTKCVAFRQKENGPLDYPVQLKSNVEKAKKYYELDLLRVYVLDNSNKKKFKAIKKSDIEWLSGQYELPTFILRSEDRSLDQYPRLGKRFAKFKNLPSLKTSITKYRITNYIWAGTQKDFYREFQSYSKVLAASEKWEELKPAQTQKLSTASLKAIKLIESIEN